MRWLKHLSNFRNREDMAELIDTAGPEAYGVWWIISEIVAEQMDKTDKCSVRFSVRKWANSCQISPKKFRNFVKILSNLKSLTAVQCKNNSDFLIIEVPILLELRDEYSRKSRQSNDNDGSESEDCQASETETETEEEEEEEEKFSDDSTEMKICNYFYSVLLKSDPGMKKPNFQNWCKDIDLFLRIDKPKKEDIKKVIDWAHDPNNATDKFSWIPNLRSPKKLRKHFKTILLQLQARNKKDNNNNYSMTV